MTDGHGLGVTAYGFHGPVDYIETITYRIWNEPDREVAAISEYYGPTTVIHLDGVDVVGAEAVVANTRDRLRSFPDFHGSIDDTIWTGSEDDGYRTSMRWTWTGTDTGGSVYGPATGRSVRFVAIANCIVRGRTIVEEWLGANPLSLARQLGVDTSTAVRATVRPADRTPTRADRPTPTPAGRLVEQALAGTLSGHQDDAAYDESVRTVLAADRSVTGRAELAAWARRLAGATGGVELHVDDQYERTEPPGPDAVAVTRVATQARLVLGSAASGAELLLVAHHHVVADRIVAQWLTFDALKLAHLGIDVDDERKETP